MQSGPSSPAVLVLINHVRDLVGCRLTVRVENQRDGTHYLNPAAIVLRQFSILWVQDYIQATFETILLNSVCVKWNSWKVAKRTFNKELTERERKPWYLKHPERVTHRLHLRLQSTKLPNQREQDFSHIIFPPLDFFLKGQCEQ